MDLIYYLILLVLFLLICSFSSGRRVLWIISSFIIGHAWLLYRHLTANTPERKAKREFIQLGYEKAKLKAAVNNGNSQSPSSINSTSSSNTYSPLSSPSNSFSNSSKTPTNSSSTNSSLQPNSTFFSSSTKKPVPFKYH